jgi:hypothetical protein
MFFNFRYSTESTHEKLMNEFESILNELNVDYEIDWKAKWTSIPHKRR